MGLVRSHDRQTSSTNLSESNLGAAAEFVKGDVVVVPFPFSDLTEAKRRLGLVLTELDGDV
jgi:hypothetical protein